MDEIQAIPRNRYLGMLADALRSTKNATGPVGDFLIGDAPRVLDQWSYGFSPVRMGNTDQGLAGAINGMSVDPGLLDVAGVAGMVPGVGRAASWAGKEALGLIDAGMMGENQLMARALKAISPDFMLKNAKTSFGGGKYQTLDVPVQWDASTPRTALQLSDDSLSMRVNPALRTDKDWIRNRGVPEAVDEFLWPFDSDVYIRNGSAKDYDYLTSGTHRGSINHIDNSPESGLSVTRSLSYPSDSAYLVRGNMINRGSDNEPVLSMNGISAASDSMTPAAMIDMYRNALSTKAKELGLSDEDLRLIRSSLNLKFP